MADLRIINYIKDESLLATRLKKTLSLLLNQLNFNKELESVYYKLWAELNEVSNKNVSQLTSLLSTCAATEILRLCLHVKENKNRHIFMHLYYELYKNVIEALTENNIKSDVNILKSHLLQTWTTHGLFRLDNLRTCGTNKAIEHIFVKMFSRLQQLEHSEQLIGTRDSVMSAAEQLIISSVKKVDYEIVLRKVLLPLASVNNSHTLFAKKNIGFLTKEHYQALSAAVARRLLFNQKCDFLNGDELKILEKAIPYINYKNAFDSLILVLQKVISNRQHPDYGHIIKMLVLLILRYTKYCAKNWENVCLKTKKRVQLMVSRLHKAMISENVKLYPQILTKYGEKLLENSPSIDITFRYLDILQFYLRRGDGKFKTELGNIFERYIHKLEWTDCLTDLIHLQCVSN